MLYAPVVLVEEVIVVGAGGEGFATSVCGSRLPCSRPSLVLLFLLFLVDNNRPGRFGNLLFAGNFDSRLHELRFFLRINQERAFAGLWIFLDERRPF